MLERLHKLFDRIHAALDKALLIINTLDDLTTVQKNQGGK